MVSTATRAEALTVNQASNNSTAGAAAPHSGLDQATANMLAEQMKPDWSKIGFNLLIVGTIVLMLAWSFKEAEVENAKYLWLDA